MFQPRLKARLRAGDTLFGLFLGIPSAALAEMAGWAGFDYVIVDTEHGSGDVEAAASMVRAAEAGGTEAVIRVAAGARERILRALDTGASGVQVPMVQSREEAEGVAAAAHYPPAGVRGIAFSIRGAHYGLTPPGVYFQRAQEILVSIQVETRRGMERLDEIAQVPGIDVLFVGPTDLAQNLGHPGELTHPEVEAAVGRIFEAAQRAGKFPGILVNDVMTAKRWMARGARFLAGNGVGLVSKTFAELAGGLRALRGV